MILNVVLLMVFNTGILVVNSIRDVIQKYCRRRINRKKALNQVRPVVEESVFITEQPLEGTVGNIT